MVALGRGAGDGDFLGGSHVDQPTKALGLNQKRERMLLNILSDAESCKLAGKRRISRDCWQRPGWTR